MVFTTSYYMLVRRVKIKSNPFRDRIAVFVNVVLDELQPRAAGSIDNFSGEFGVEELYRFVQRLID